MLGVVAPFFLGWAVSAYFIPNEPTLAHIFIALLSVQHRLAVGLGMIPRGEVGLIFAGIGATLMLPSATGVSEPVINSSTFGAVVIMVIITTLITPIALKWSLGRTSNSKGRVDHGNKEGHA